MQQTVPQSTFTLFKICFCGPVALTLIPAHNLEAEKVGGKIVKEMRFDLKKL